VRPIHGWLGAAAVGVSVLAASSAYVTPAAQASSAGHAVLAQRAQGKAKPPAKTATLPGNTDAAMPAAAISSTDGLPAVLVNGHSYRLTVHVGVAAGQPTTDAELLVSGGAHPVCLTQRLRSGAISTLHCTFVAVAVGRTDLQIKVLVGAARGGQLVATFCHVVVRTTSPE
jgi:hypothetical protein